MAEDVATGTVSALVRRWSVEPRSDAPLAAAAAAAAIAPPARGKIEETSAAEAAQADCAAGSDALPGRGLGASVEADLREHREVQDASLALGCEEVGGGDSVFEGASGSQDETVDALSHQAIRQAARVLIYELHSSAAHGVEYFDISDDSDTELQLSPPWARSCAGWRVLVPLLGVALFATLAAFLQAPLGGRVSLPVDVESSVPAWPCDSVDDFCARAVAGELSGQRDLEGMGLGVKDIEDPVVGLE